MSTIKITGGVSLRGDIYPIANKNAILKVIPAAVLTDKTCIYHDVPKTSDVARLLNIMRSIGADIDCSDYSKITINCKNITSYEVNSEDGSKLRASIMLVGPLLARFGKAKIPIPGGCELGKRSISAHIDAFQKVGADVTIEGDNAIFSIASDKKNHNYSVWQQEASVTATENLILYAAGIEKKINIFDAACEPHVRQLMEYLDIMGARTLGKGSNSVTVIGRSKLQGFNYYPIPDHIDIAGYIVAAAITKGYIRIKNSNIPYIVDGMIQAFEKFGVNISREKDDLIIDGESSNINVDIDNSGMPLAASNMPKFIPRPWPGFPVDALPVIAVLACKSDGNIQLQNWMYENGLNFAKSLNKLGAQIVICDPYRIIVKGKVSFISGEVETPKVIQAAKAIFLAALCDNTQIIIKGADILSRRYPDIVGAYRSLGANIEPVN